MADEPVPDNRPPRVNFIGAPEFYNLNAACLLVTEAFRNISFGVFHVGSSITRKDYRDVDVRCIMRDEDFERMFAAKRGGWTNALWSLLCVSISAWLKERTGLPIDFQIQSQTEANEDDGRRNALGIFVPRHQVVEAEAVLERAREATEAQRVAELAGEAVGDLPEMTLRTEAQE